MLYVVIPWVSVSVLFCLALVRASVRPVPEFEEHGDAVSSRALAPEPSVATETDRHTTAVANNRPNPIYSGAAAA